MSHYVRNVYHIEGVTDLAALKTAAEERARHGGITMIHQHGSALHCRSACRLVAPKEETQS